MQIGEDERRDGLSAHVVGARAVLIRGPAGSGKSSLAFGTLYAEAQRRGYALYHYTPPSLVFRDRRVMARVEPMALRREKRLTGTMYGSQQTFTVLANGRIVKSGGKELALELEDKGYDWLQNTGAAASAGSAA